MLKKGLKSQENFFKGLFRHYSELDLKEVERLRDMAKSQTKINRIDLDALYASFDAYSLFSIFEDDLKLLQKIHQ